MEAHPYNLEKNYVSLEQKDILLDYLRSKHNLDFRNYSESSVRRRISKILNEMRLNDVQQYISYLEENTDPKALFLEKFTVNVTEMFRDPFLFSSLMDTIKQELNTQDSLSIWSAGCSSGEEMLSLAILLHEQRLLDRVKMLGTDLSSSVLHMANKRTYKLRHIESYETAYEEAGGQNKLSDYYKLSGDEVVFHDNLYQSLSFIEHDLMTTPPANNFDMILCRNVLIYFNPQLQDRILSMFSKALSTGGHLVLGSKESIIFYQERNIYSEVEPESRIYKKIK